MGGLFEENLSKTEGNRRTRPAFLHNILKFLTRVEGGIGGPNTPVSALGSPVNFTPNLSLIKIQTTTRAGFTITFTWTLRADACFKDSLATGIENLNNFRRKIRRFQPVNAAAWNTECGLCEKLELAGWRRWCSAKSCLTTADRQNVLHKANGTRGATFAAPNRWFLWQIFK